MTNPITHRYGTQHRLILCSDIHLGSGALDPVDFAHLLQQWSNQADAVYILGDCFDYWINDYCEERYQSLFQTLTKSSLKKPVYFMAGNRDFTISNQILSKLGIQKIPDPCVVKIHDKVLILTHGDQLCLNDHHYLRMRAIIQHPLSLSLFHSIPTALQQALAHWIKKKSKSATARKPQKTMQTSPQAIQTWINHHHADYLIHGHVHKLADYSVIHQQKTARVLSLDAWEHQFNCLCITGSEPNFDFILGQDILKATSKNKGASSNKSPCTTSHL